jgi:hypothetical protein
MRFRPSGASRHTTGITTALSLALLAMIAVGCGGSRNDSSPAASSATTSDATPPAAMSAIPLARDLTEDEMRRYVALMGDFRKLGLETRDMQAQGAGAALAGAQVHGETMEALRRHGFTVPQFEEVHYNVIMAWSALEMEGKSAEMERSRAEQEKALEAMKRTMSEEQVRAMKAQLDMANQQVETMTQSSEHNRALIRAHHADLIAVLKR